MPLILMLVTPAFHKNRPLPINKTSVIDNLYCDGSISFERFLKTPKKKKKTVSSTLVARKIS